MKLYRVEYTEKDVIKDLPKGYGDVARLSLAAYTEQDVITKVNYLLDAYKKELKTNNYYIKIYNYEID